MKKADNKQKDKKVKSWKEQNRCVFDNDKRREFIELIKRDVTRESACAFLQIPQSTLQSRMERDAGLSSEYHKAKERMGIACQNVIVNAINDKELPTSEKYKLAMERNKRRDKRYSDKVDTTSEVVQKIIIEKA